MVQFFTSTKGVTASGTVFTFALMALSLLLYSHSQPRASTPEQMMLSSGC